MKNRKRYVACLTAVSFCAIASIAVCAGNDNPESRSANGPAIDRLSLGTSTSRVTAVSAGWTRTFWLKEDGSVWGCGHGLATSPNLYAEWVGITAISPGNDCSIARKNDGTVWASGVNTYGQLGDGTTTERTSPVQVSSLSGITTVNAGYFYSAAIKSDGSLWTWGYNSYGMLGNGSTTDQYTPAQILSSVTSVSLNTYHTLVLKNDGTVWACGYNGYGQLGDNTTTTRYSPVQVNTLSGISAIAAGHSHSLALKSDGTVYAWGYNDSGRLGDGSTTDSHTPVQVSGLSGVAAIAAGTSHSVALKNDGTVWTWGGNSSGQLGDGTTSSRTTPAQVNDLSNITAISAKGNYTEVVKSNGAAYAWGNGTSSQLGDGGSQDRAIPVLVISAPSTNQAAAPSAPTGVTASKGTYTDRVTISWTAVTNATGYNVARSVQNDVSSASQIGSTTATTYDDTTVTAGSNYYFWVQATNADGFSSYSLSDSGYAATGSTNTAIPVRVAVYRLYSYGAPESTYEHLWTISATERDTLDSWPSWQYEGIAWYAYGTQVSGSTPLYRLYAPGVKQHHYTTDEAEYTALADNGTWNGEGIQYYVFGTQGANMVPVYRFYHSGQYLHHFTVSETEKAGIIAHPEWGYAYEFPAFYVYERASEDFCANTIIRTNVLHSGEYLVDAARAPDGTLGLLHCTYSTNPWDVGPLQYEVITVSGTVVTNVSLQYGKNEIETTYAKLVYDQSSKAHIFYLSGSSPIHIYQYGASSVWTNEDITCYSGSLSDLNVALDSQNAFHLVGQCSTGNTEVVLAHITNNQGSWNYESIPFSKTATMRLRYIHMTLDDSNYLHIVLSFQDQISQDVMWPAYLYYLTNRSGAWVGELVSYISESSWDACFIYPSIAIYGGNTPAIASWLKYNVITGSDALSQLVYLTRNSAGSWAMSVLADTSDNYSGTDGDHFTGIEPHLKFDNYGNGYLIFSDLASSHINGYETMWFGQVRFASNTGSGWSLSTPYRQNVSLNEEVMKKVLVLAPDGGINIFALVLPGYYIVHFSSYY